VRHGAAALAAGGRILADCEMVAAGITRRLLPRGNEVVCLINDKRVRGMARRRGSTRSAAAVDLWGTSLAGSVAAIGNAPTALFRLLERIDEGTVPPALIVAMPVGFVGAAEAKQALVDYGGDVGYIAVTGRRGGSALAAAAINQLAIEAGR
jgi:precorrin-8X/cobalt-precorrin-8 methylmutase